MANDYFSFEKELKEIEDMDKIFNIVPLISRVNGLPIDKSLVETTKMIAKYEGLIFELEKQIMSQVEPKAETEALIERINYLVGGSYKAHTVVDRYSKFNQ